MNWNYYFNTLERINKIKLDNDLKNTIINHFKDDLLLYTEQDIYEQTRRLIYNSKYNRR